MADPTTRSSTPPQSGRIAQQSPSTAVVVPLYDDVSFPPIAFTGQLAINKDNKTLGYFDENGAWQGVVGAQDIQSFYGPVAPTIGVNVGDRWYNTSTGLWNLWTGTAWLPGNASFSSTAPTTPSVGDAWYNLGNGEVRYWNGTGWVLISDSTAPGVYTGAIPAAANAGSVWTDTLGVVRRCITTYTSSPSMAYWVQMTTAADPLSQLIPLSGIRIDAGEATAPPNPTPSTTITVAVGMVWKDTQAGSTELGSFFVYTGSSWVKVTDQATLATCAALTPQPSSAPAASPTLTVKPLSSSFVLETTDIAATSQIEYHVSTTTGFTPGPTTLLATTRSQVLQTKLQADGVTPYVPNTTYFFKVVAKNTLGSAPASTEVSATLSLITNGQVNDVAVDKLTAGNLTAAMALLGSLQVGQISITPGDGTSTNPGGIVIPLSNGGTINLPANGDPAQFLGVILEATQLLVDDNFELRGATNRIAGTLNLNASIGAPATGPTVIQSWADPNIALQTNCLTISGSWMPHLTDGGTVWFVACTDSDSTLRGIYSIDKTTGAATRVLAIAPSVDIQGLTKVNSTTYIVVTSNGSTWTTRIYNASWVQTSSWTLTCTYNNASRHGAYLTGIYSDGTYLWASWDVILDVSPYTDFKGLSRYDYATGGTPTNAADTGNNNYNYFPTGLYVGSADFGAARWVEQGSTTAFYPRATTGFPATELTANRWTRPGTGAPLGFGWDGTNFFTFDTDGVIWRHNTNPAAVAQSVRYSQYDSDTSAPSASTHETPWSPAVSYSQPPRTYFKVSTPAPADAGGIDDPNTIRHYIQSGGAGSYFRQADVTAAPWAVYYGVPSTAGATAVSTPDFSGVSNPGLVTSAAADGTGPIINLKGSGDGRAGPYLWGTNGQLDAIFCYKTTAQAISNSVSTAVLFDQTRNITGAITLDASGWVKVAKAGWYQVNGNATWAASASTAQRIVGVVTNTSASVTGATFHTGTIFAVGAWGTSPSAVLLGESTSALVYLAANSYVNIWVNQNSGGGYSLQVTNTYMNTLSVVYVGGF